MKTYNIELEMSVEQKNFLITLLREYTSVVNEVSNSIVASKIPLAIKLIHDSCYQTERELHPTLPSQMIIKAQQESKSTIQSFKSNHKKLPDKAPVKKKSSLRLDKRLYSRLTPLSIDLISPVKNKRMKVSFKLFEKVEELFKTTPVLDPLLFEKDGRLFLSITFNTPKIPVQNNTALGVDLGINRLVSTSDGMVISGREYVKHKRRLRYLRRQLQSVGTKSAKRRLKKVKRKEANFSKNYMHHVANEILDTDKSIIVMEDLTKIKKKSRGRRFNNRLSQIPFGTIKSILIYKTEHVGKRVQTVNPAYTSQDDYRGLERGKRKGCRYYAVDGKVFDSDVQASVNILHRYDQHALSFVEPIDGSFKPMSQVLCQQTNRSGLSTASPSL